MSTSIESINSLGNYMSLLQMNAQSMQQRHDDLFSKLDSDSNSGIDKVEFSAFAKKLSEGSGNSLNVDDVFSQYDVNGDVSLSSDELQSFMKDNGPPPPPPNGMGGSPGMNGQSDDLFAKLDSNSDGGIDKNEFSTFAEKLSKDTGNSINVDNVFSTYDTNNEHLEQRGDEGLHEGQCSASAGPNAKCRLGLWDGPEQRPDIDPDGFAQESVSH